MNTGPINCSLHAGRVDEEFVVNVVGEDGSGVVLDHVVPLVFPQVVAEKTPSSSSWCCGAPGSTGWKQRTFSTLRR